MISRDISSSALYAHPATLNCAENLCVPCLYKISPTGEFGDVKAPPNQRPEQCIRASKDYLHPTSDSGGLYIGDNFQTILTVGDGDFSFSLSIARALSRTRATSTLVATSHESYESVLRTYPGIKDTLSELRNLGVQVYHDVDATSLRSCPNIGKTRFDVIIWNFPCVGVSNAGNVGRPTDPATETQKKEREETQANAQGSDGQVAELDQNKLLLTAFFRNIRKNLTKAPKVPKTGTGADTGAAHRAGEVHIVHKTLEPFSWWDLPALNAHSGSKLQFAHRVVFDRCLYPGYVNRKVLHKKSFPSHDAETFIFCRSENVVCDGNGIEGNACRSRCVDALQLVRLYLGSTALQNMLVASQKAARQVGRKRKRSS